MTAGKFIVAIAAFLALGTGAGAEANCAGPADSELMRDAAPSEVQVLWSRKSLIYANTTEFYAACSYQVSRSGGNARVETYLKPGQSMTRQGVSGVLSNPADCTIYIVKPCDTDGRWDH